MKLVSQTEYLAQLFGEEEAVRMLAKAGYDGIDWSFGEIMKMSDFETRPWYQDGWRDRAHQMRELADSLGVTIEQAHAPMPLSRGVEEYDSIILDKVLMTMEAASIMGVKNIVVHPKQHKVPFLNSQKEMFDANVEMYKALIPYCEKWNIIVCTENMWHVGFDNRTIINSVCADPTEFRDMIDAVNSPWIRGCLDIGHCFVCNIDPVFAIRTLGKERIACLHVHDVDYSDDCHTLPYIRRINWDAVLNALAEIGYEGHLTYEADCFLRGFPVDFQQEAANFMEQVGRMMIRKFEAARA